jgi:hypothetical protein
MSGKCCKVWRGRRSPLFCAAFAEKYPALTSGLYDVYLVQVAGSCAEQACSLGRLDTDRKPDGADGVDIWSVGVFEKPDERVSPGKPYWTLLVCRFRTTGRVHWRVSVNKVRSFCVLRTTGEIFEQLSDLKLMKEQSAAWRGQFVPEPWEHY